MISKFSPLSTMPKWNVYAWITTALCGVAVPVLMLFGLSAVGTGSDLSGGPVLTLGLMGVGIIAAATAGRFWVGVVLAVLNTICLLGLALALGVQAAAHPFSIAIAVVVASVSFAARGALFATSLSSKGWLMALFVVAGEASILLTAIFLPGLLPTWLLALLPAQWTNVALQASLTGAGAVAAKWSLLALAGTAVTTMFTAKLWPRRWPYLIMFTSWLGFSALVYFSTTQAPV